jgi:hypothetical protein
VLVDLYTLGKETKRETTNKGYYIITLMLVQIIQLSKRV